MSQQPADDRDRKTGAPVKKDETLPAVPALAFKTRWEVDNTSCPEESPHGLRCTVAQIWAGRSPSARRAMRSR